MRVLFLDVDGVCNSLASHFAFHTYNRFCPVSVGLLSRACVLFDLHVVLSSAWRIGQDVAGCRRIFQSRRFPVIASRLIDKTPALPGVRGEEIAQWLAEHPDVLEYVIVDDDSDMLPEQMPRFVNTYHMDGFRLREYAKLVSLFDPEHKDLRSLRPFLEFKKDELRW